MVTRKLILDINNTNTYTELIVKGEIDSRFLEINFMQGGNNYDLTNDRVFIDMVFPDSSTLSMELTVTNAGKGLVLMPLTSQISSQLGNVSCVIHVKDSTTLTIILSIITLKFVVIDSTSTTNIESSSEFTALQNALVGINGKVSDVKVNGNKLVKDTNGIVDVPCATQEQGTKANNAIQSVEVNGVVLTPDINKKVSMTCATTTQGTKADNALPASSYTASDVLTKVKSVDGTGSGLDSDLLQGKTLSALLLLLHPIGDLIFNTSGTNPSTYIGGTWVAWGAGKVPVSMDTTQTEFNTVEKTGGEKTHTLTINEMPSHNHMTTNIAGYFAYGGDDTTNGPAYGTGYRTDLSTRGTGSSGADVAHNNLQPYITCYMWKRTA